MDYCFHWILLYCFVINCNINMIPNYKKKLQYTAYSPTYAKKSSDFEIFNSGKINKYNYEDWNSDIKKITDFYLTKGSKQPQKPIKHNVYHNNIQNQKFKQIIKLDLDLKKKNSQTSLNNDTRNNNQQLYINNYTSRMQEISQQKNNGYKSLNRKNREHYDTLINSPLKQLYQKYTKKKKQYEQQNYRKQKVQDYPLDTQRAPLSNMYISQRDTRTLSGKIKKVKDQKSSDYERALLRKRLQQKIVQLKKRNKSNDKVINEQLKKSISTQNLHNIINGKQNPQLNEIYQRTQELINSYKQREKNWQIEKNKYIQEIKLLKKRLQFYE